jgi:hypothetical protein
VESPVYFSINDVFSLSFFQIVFFLLCMCLFCTIACGVWETLTGLQFRVIEFFVVAFTEFLLIVEFQAGYRGLSKGGGGGQVPPHFLAESCSKFLH